MSEPTDARLAYGSAIDHAHRGSVYIDVLRAAVALGDAPLTARALVAIHESLKLRQYIAAVPPAWGTVGDGAAVLESEGGRGRGRARTWRLVAGAVAQVDALARERLRAEVPS